MKYSTGFRNAVLRKVLPPENRSVTSVAKEMGISPITIQSWLSKLNDGSLVIDDNDADLPPNQRSYSEKLKLLIESKTISDENLGEWLRQHGIHEEHLTQWEQQLESIVKDKQERLQKENSELKKRIRELEKESKRDKAAMAEALALLTLKKKAEALFNSDEEES